MTLGNQIATLRKERGLTQEALAQNLDVSNQAVSKWESDQCCPDITLLPKIADLFGVTIDFLFGRPAACEKELPWEDDDTLRLRLFRGKQLLCDKEATGRLEIHWSGPVLNLDSTVSVACDEVYGNVTAAGSVTCDDVAGDVHAGGNVTCGDVGCDVRSGGNTTCDNVSGDVQAGCDITCDRIGGNATAGRNIHHN